MLTGNKAHRVFIHLADDEWGNQAMERIARQYAEANPDKANLLMTVYEHGGWVLEWFADLAAGIFMIVGTANDGAIFSPEQEAVRTFLRRSDLSWEYLPEVWRQKAVAAAA